MLAQNNKKTDLSNSLFMGTNIEFPLESELDLRTLNLSRSKLHQS